MLKKFWALLLIGFLLLPITIFSVEPTHEFQLSNGLKLIVREDHRAPVVLSSIWYRVGGAYEHSGITGISHALEHTMFNGTKQFGPGVLKKMVTENGGDINAMTVTDFTMYHEKLAADKLPIAFMLESDRMRGLLLDPEVFGREIKVILEERRMRVDDDPHQLVLERQLAAAYVNSPYHNPVIGWIPDIKSLTIDDLRQWYHTFYAPNNAVLLVIGDVKPDAVYQLAQKYFGNLKPETIPQMKPRTEVESLGPKKLEITTAAQLPWIVMSFITPSLITTDVSWKPYALMVANYILGSLDSSRLQKTMVRQNEIATDVQTEYDPFQKYDALFSFSATPAPNHTLEELQDAFIGEVKKLQTDLVSDEELNRVKAQILSQNIYQRDSISNQAYLLGVPEMIGLSWKEGDAFADRLNAVTAEQVRQVAQQYLVETRLTTSILKPKKDN